MEYIVFIVIVVLFVAIIFVKGIIDEKSRRKQFAAKLKKDYGSFPQKDYKQEQYESISHYYRKHIPEKTIDDITWNDLEMDRLFQLMNHTCSSAGEEYLYYTLRCPEYDTEELDKLEDLIKYFDSHEEHRVDLQLLFADLGKTGKFSLSDYLDYLDNLGERNNKKQIFINSLYLVSIGLIFILPSLGIISLFSLITYNIVAYFKEKGEIEPYITSFAYILRLIKNVDKLKGLNISALKDKQEELNRYRKELKNFTRNASLVVSGKSMSGNPIEILMDYVKMTFHLDIMKFNSMLSLVRDNTNAINEMLKIMGYIETSIAITLFRASLNFYCIPDFKEFTGNGGIQTEDIYHPYINDPVTNSIKANRGILLTGSNASGKSTFLKTIALNAVMAQTIHTATAKRFQTSFYRIYSSMSLRDDLGGGESYYIVEIKALKRILDAAFSSEEPVLCFVDEVLRGTNTVERIAASTQILKSLSTARILCFAATHDIELTKLLDKIYDNYHFTEEIKKGDVLFNYKLLPGRAVTRNAIKLLSVIGYQDEIIEAAAKMAEDFMATGEWD